MSGYFAGYFARCVEALVAWTPARQLLSTLQCVLLYIRAIFNYMLQSLFAFIKGQRKRPA